VVLALAACDPPGMRGLGQPATPKQLTAQDAAKNVKGTVYVASGGRIWRLRGGGVTALTGTDKNIAYPAVTTDGQRTAAAVISAGHSEIAVGGADFGGLNPLTAPPKDPHAASIDLKPAFSPDSGRLAFMSDRGRCCSDQQIWEGPYAPYKPRQVSTPPDLTGGDDAPVYAGATSLLFVAWRPVGNDTRNIHAGLMQAGVPTGKLKALLAPADSDIIDPAVAADGRLAFVRRKGDSADVEVSGADAANPVKITSFGDVRQPAWSPDGLSIVFISRHGGSVDLWSVAADGKGDPQRLTWGADLDDNSRPAWIAAG
jgi:hypothetical protein